MKKYRYEKKFIEALEKYSNISLACEKIGLSRQSAYRWMDEDENFKGRVDAAMQRGIDSLCDLAERKLVTNINNGNQRAIEFFLGSHKKQYYRPRKPIAPEEQRLVPIKSVQFIHLDNTQGLIDHLTSSNDDVSKLAGNLSRKSNRLPLNESGQL